MPNRCPNCDYELVGIGDEQAALCPECNMTVVLPSAPRSSRPSLFSLSLWAAVAITPLVIVANEVLAGHPGVIVGAAWSAPLFAILAYIGVRLLPRSQRIAASLVGGFLGGLVCGVTSNVIAEILLDLYR